MAHIFIIVLLETNMFSFISALIVPNIVWCVTKFLLCRINFVTFVFVQRATLHNGDNIPYEKIGKNEPVSIADEVPFEIPESWEWVRLKSLGAPVDDAFADGPFGSNLKKEHYTEEHEVRLIQLSNIGDEGWKDANTKYTTYKHAKTLSRSMVKPGCIVIAKMMPAGRAIIVPDLETDYILSSDAVKFIPNERLDAEYLLFAINSPGFRNQVVAEAHGVTRVRTSLGKLQTYYLPIPPLKEQKRIVHQIKNIYPLIKKYESGESKRLELDSLFPDLLKKSILQEAVMGRLVPQDPSDEPASVLLDKIRAEKQRLIAEGKLKKDKHESIIYRRDNSHYEKLDGVERCIDDEIPFEIPDSWEWVRLKTVGITQTGNTPSKARPENFGNDIPFIGPGDIQNADINYCNQGLSALGKESGRVTPKGSILQVCIGGSIGKAAITLKEVAFNQQINAIIPLIIDSHYLYHIMTSPYYIEYMKESAGGTATPIINRSLWDNLLVPIAPHNEQRRIALKISEAFIKAESL